VIYLINAIDGKENDAVPFKNNREHNCALKLRSSMQSACCIVGVRKRVAFVAFFYFFSQAACCRGRRSSYCDCLMRNLLRNCCVCVVCLNAAA